MVHVVLTCFKGTYEKPLNIETFSLGIIIKKDQGLNQIVSLITSLLFSLLRELQRKNFSFDYKYRKSEIV